MLIYGGEDEFVDEDMRKSCSELMVIWLALSTLSPDATSYNTREAACASS